MVKNNRPRPEDQSTTEATTNPTKVELGADINRSSWLDVAMVSINNHLQVFRTLPWVLGGVGAFLIIKYSGMFTRYYKVTDIPTDLITRGATLRGVAVGVWPDTCLDVWHIPPGRQLLRWRHKPPTPYHSDQVLGVRLAGLAIAQPEMVRKWTSSNLIGRSLQLELVHHSINDDCIHCIVKYRKGYFQHLKCVNIELLALGLATLQDPSSHHGYHGNDSSPGNNERLIKFLSEGVQAERGAQSRGEGVWKGSEHESKWRKIARFLKLKN